MKHFRLFAILLLLVCGWTTVAHGQTQEPAINLEFTDIPLSEAISRIEKSSKYTFFYDAKQTDLTRRVSLPRQTAADLRRPAPDARPDGSQFHDLRTPDRPDPAARKAPGRTAHDTGTVNDSHDFPWPASPSRWRATIRAAPCPRTTAVSPSPFPMPMRCSASPIWATSPRKSPSPPRRTTSRYSSPRTP